MKNNLPIIKCEYEVNYELRLIMGLEKKKIRNKLHNINLKIIITIINILDFEILLFY